MLDEILIAVYLILVGALFGGMIKDVSLDKIRDENLVLKAANTQLKEQVKELDYKQAELTKKNSRNERNRRIRDAKLV